MSKRALFEGLVVNPAGQPVTVAYVGGEAQYVVPDADFAFRVEAAGVDRQVLGALRDQILQNKEAVTEGALKMLGQEDLFTKAMVDASLNNMEANFAKLMDRGLPENARAYLGMLGFRVVLNYHGEVERLDQPGLPSEEGE